MGLDCSHGAWSGAYYRFNRFRQYLAKTIGGSWPPHDPEFRMPDGTAPSRHDWYRDDDIAPEHTVGILALMNHSDCDGDLSPEECAAVAAWLRWAIPLLPEKVGGDRPRVDAEQFAAGCELAHSRGEHLFFD